MRFNITDLKIEAFPFENYPPIIDSAGPYESGTEWKIKCTSRSGMARCQLY